MISGYVPAQPVSRLRRIELAAVSGMAGAALFVAAFTIQAWMYPGYSWTAMFVSELSLGPHGWIQILNFVLTGAIAMLKISQQPGTGLFEWKGLVQRVLLVTIMAWLFAVAFRLRSNCRHPDGPPN